MTLPGSLFVIGLPIALAGVLMLLRRWTALMAWSAAAAMSFLGVLVTTATLNVAYPIGPLNLYLGRPFYLLGRVLVIEPADRLPLAFIYFTAAGLFVIAWRLLPHSNFFPIGLVMVALLGAVLMVHQVVYAALLVEMAAILAVFPLHESGGRAHGGLRYIAYVTLALPGLMITQLLLELFAIFPADMGLLQTSTVLLGISFAILLGAVPFQSWLSTVATDGSPPVVTFLFTVHLGTVWFMLLAYLQSYAWLGRQPLFEPLFTALGLLMMIVGGALAASQRRMGRLVGYAILVDNGAMFVALGTRQTAGLALTLMMLLARPVALGLMTIGLDGLRQLGGGDDSATAMQGMAWSAPWRTVAFLVGGVAMAGFPLSLGFAARWGLYRLMARQDLFQALLALSGSAGVMMGLVGVIRTLLVPASTDAKPRAPLAEDPVVLVLIIVLIGATLALGLFPQGASRVALEMAESFTFFAP